ncbi:MAG: DUF4293 domain-containing protein [Flavobacteriales bacterium]|nr:DUF4293 domain-containing protein [Flavobacteriales bacterium]
MIQRIQSIYLLISVIALCISILFPIMTFEDGSMLSLIGIDGSKTDDISWFPVASGILLAITTIISAMSIFAYKNRGRQIKLIGLAMLGSLFILINVLIAAFVTSWEGKFQLSTILVALPLILLFMARDRVKKDEKLVKSLDRIR